MYRFHWNDEFCKKGMKAMREAFENRHGHDVSSDDCIGQARTGDVCFDLVIRDCRETDEPEDDRKLFLGFDLYVGGCDTGYGYSAEDAMLDGKYKSKHEVPPEELYPYDEWDGCGGPLEDYIGLSFEEFIEVAESEMSGYLDSIKNPGVREAINRPFHYW
ncbi:MAG: hypothetical protein IIY48_07980 [Clostridia bacterium]|nr:hypothetical protein [Clostridia bacterium]MBQ5581139.1 hypothetical protein [Clostridia bacterium]